ncbi:MAG: sigma-54-dependent Fis family transcriptional regulator [Deltaproteobacteria bacterium]|nr:sigma-54-dependent Fis family transcriptional regulator [Deltaproteobacteria bacterium]
MNRKSILIVDDDQSMKSALAESLESCGYKTQAVENGHEALAMFKQRKFDLVLTDMKMPGITGIEVLKSVKLMSPETPVILITAYGTVNTAVEAMKEGAAEFIMKPFTLDDLESAVQNVLSISEVEPADIPEVTPVTSKIVTRDPKFIAILDTLRNVAKSKANILIQGESGTGKELLARYIHEHSRRRKNPFVAVNCAAIPHNLLESEMFGYEKGAFTGASQKKLGKFELADTGTLLLDEVSEMDVQLQAKLLRVIQESEVDRVGGSAPIPIDVRIIATTNTDLSRAIENKTFRSDLFYRLNVIPVKIPPLRERKSDILNLSNHFLKIFGKEKGVKNIALSNKAAALLESYNFPGNIRELENIIERAVLMTGSHTIPPEALGLEESSSRQPEINTPSANILDSPTVSNGTSSGESMTLKEVEKALICDTLAKVEGNKTKAAKILGISVRTLWNKVQEYGMQDNENTGLQSPDGPSR